MPETDKWVEYGQAGGECDKPKELLLLKDDTAQCGKCNGLGWIESRDHISGYVDADPCECRKAEVPPQ